MNPKKRTRSGLLYASLGCGAVLAICSCDSSPKTPPTATELLATTNRLSHARKIDKTAPVDRRIMVILTEQLGLKTEPKSTDRLIKDLGCDSLDIVELVMAMEEEFEVEISDAEAVKIQTVADAISCIENLLKHKAAK